MTVIKGQQVSLRPATISDRRQIFEWLAESDITSNMLGPPHFPDNLVPGWEEFLSDYTDDYFGHGNPAVGRSFIIEFHGSQAGHISYNLLDEETRTVEFDIWMAGSYWCNKGLGTDAINALCGFLELSAGYKMFVLAPSLRNKGAVKAYQKCGFEPVEKPPPNFIPDYSDTIVLVRKGV
ncbi:MAG TPA: GNAT family N-acetyltransferase [Chitinophagaceae bacterium]|nr:GNAT family N-acetyltransferase [Chitinophagaceae bacterium]